MGEWNSKIGYKTRWGKGVQGPYGMVGERNESGEKLIQLAKANNMKIADSFFKKRKSKMWTCGNHQTEKQKIKSTFYCGDSRISRLPAYLGLPL